MRRLTDEEFKERLLNYNNGEYENVEPYINKRTKILFKHKCGKKFYSYPMDVLYGKKHCPVCIKKKISELTRKPKEKFLEEFNELAKGEYTLLTDYEKSNKKVIIKHNVCGHKFEVTPNNFISKKSRCPLCFGGNIKKTKEQFKQEILELTDGELIVIGDYTNKNTLIEVLHTECNQVFMAYPKSLLRGCSCSHCKESKGEREVKRVLKKLNLQFKKQYRFKDCRGKKYPLPFDFAAIKDDKIDFLIEYDGEQHFKPIQFRGINDKKALKLHKETLERDNIKTKYCLNKNISLLRIPYYNFNKIEEIICQYVNTEPS